MTEPPTRNTTFLNTSYQGINPSFYFTIKMNPPKMTDTTRNNIIKRE